MSAFSWRELCEADLPAALNLHPGNLGDEIVGRPVALRIWRDLVKNLAFRGIVIEADPPISGHRIIGAGASVFVSSEFMNAEIEEPRPGLNSRIIASVASGRSVLLKRSEIGEANAGAGVDIVNILGSWSKELLSGDQVAEVNAVMTASFMDAHRGYRLGRLLREVPCREELEAARGLFQVLAEDSDLGRSTVLLTRQLALSTGYSMVALMFQYQEPVLRLNESDQQLLSAALKGHTDGELSAEVKVSLPAIKGRWLSVFAKLSRVRPDLLDVAEPDADIGRGRQKRHIALSYVRNHPEELRPFAWPRPKARTQRRSPNTKT